MKNLIRARIRRGEINLILFNLTVLGLFAGLYFSGSSIVGYFRGTEPSLEEKKLATNIALPQ